MLKFKGIINHNNDGSTLTKETGFTVLKGGYNKLNPTMRGWKVFVQWQDETTTQMYLKDFKEASPIELAEYTVVNKLDDQPAFAWWVHYFFKK